MANTVQKENREEKEKGKEAHLPGPPRPNLPPRSPSPPGSVVFPRQGHAQLRARDAVAAGSCLPAWRPPAPSPRATTTPGRRPVLSLSPVPAPPSLSLVQANDRNHTGAAAMELVARVS